MAKWQPRVVSLRPEDETWFDQLGWTVEYDDAEGWVWAGLRRKDNPGANLIPKYGRGHSPEEALAAARRRYQVEQIG